MARKSGAVAIAGRHFALWSAALAALVALPASVVPVGAHPMPARSPGPVLWGGMWREGGLCVRALSLRGGRSDYSYGEGDDDDPDVAGAGGEDTPEGWSHSSRYEKDADGGAEGEPGAIDGLEEEETAPRRGRGPILEMGGGETLAVDAKALLTSRKLDDSSRPSGSGGGSGSRDPLSMDSAEAGSVLDDENSADVVVPALQMKEVGGGAMEDGGDDEEELLRRALDGVDDDQLIDGGADNAPDGPDDHHASDDVAPVAGQGAGGAGEGRDVGEGQARTSAGGGRQRAASPDIVSARHDGAGSSVEEIGGDMVNSEDALKQDTLRYEPGELDVAVEGHAPEAGDGVTQPRALKTSAGVPLDDPELYAAMGDGGSSNEVLDAFFGASPAATDKTATISAGAAAGGAAAAEGGVADGAAAAAATEAAAAVVHRQRDEYDPLVVSDELYPVEAASNGGGAEQGEGRGEVGGEEQRDDMDVDGAEAEGEEDEDMSSSAALVPPPLKPPHAGRPGINHTVGEGMDAGHPGVTERTESPGGLSAATSHRPPQAVGGAAAGGIEEDGGGGVYEDQLVDDDVRNLQQEMRAAEKAADAPGPALNSATMAEMQTMAPELAILELQNAKKRASAEEKVERERERPRE